MQNNVWMKDNSGKISDVNERKGDLVSVEDGVKLREKKPHTFWAKNSFPVVGN